MSDEANDSGEEQPGDKLPTDDSRGKEKKGLGSRRGIETMFRTTYRVHMDLTALADTKANIMISINGLILSIVLAAVAPKIDSNAWLLVPTTVLLLSCLGALIFAVLAARPRVIASDITLEDVRSGTRSLLFFGNYTNLPEETFAAGMVELIQDPDLLYTNMIRDVYGIGRVLSRKFSLLTKAYNFFMYGLIVSVAAFIIVFVTQASAAP